MEKPRISDIPSIKKLLEDVHNMEQVARVFPLLKPMLRLAGVHVGRMEEALTRSKDVAAAVRRLSTLPDRFNDHFAERGWIAYDSLDVEVAQAALDKVEAGDLEEAERLLVEYYGEDTVSLKITAMMAVEAFRPRLPRARQALADYLENRYHACVPVILMLLDGMVGDVGKKMGKSHGFFAEGVDLEAWDSVAAHSTGLARLSKVMGESRVKTTTDPITIPYRHGILHGTDLGYDNKMVAAKAWAALFAAREWALKAERKELTASPEKPKKGLGDLFRQLQENAETKAWLDAWEPHDVQPGLDIPVSGAPEEYNQGAPERKLAEFLAYWFDRNYGGMARCLPWFDRGHLDKTAGEMRAQYASKTLQAFEFLEVRDEAAGVTEIRAKLRYEEDGNTAERIIDYRLIYEDAQGDPVVRGKPGADWAIYAGYV